MENRYPYQDKNLAADERAADLLSRMTLTEKAGQLNQRLYGFSCYERSGESIALTKTFTDEVQKWGGLGVLYGLYRADPWSKRDYSNGITPAMAAKAYNIAQRYVLEHSRLSIPMLLSSECPHGHQALDGYLLPVGLSMGATFNPELVRSAFGVCGAQLKETGINLALISVLDVLRDPRWGRSEECFSEDPFLCSRLAEAAVRGISEKNVGVVAKHFCAQGEGTGGINASAARIGERELREIHLPAAEACIKAGACGIMAAYNELDGLPCHADKWLLTDVLRGEMGFDGIVMADGTAIDRLDAMTGDNVRSGALALEAGVDVSLWDNGFAGLEQAVNRGYVSEDRLNEAVMRVLKLKFSLGLFENPYLDEEKQPETYTCEKYPQQLELARQSAVLLKNEGDILPLSRKKPLSIAVIGPNADSIYNQLGDYSPPVEAGVTLLSGIRSLAGESIRVEYASGCGICSRTEADREQIAIAREIALRCDVVILALGGSSGRFGEARFDSNGAAIAAGDSQMDCGEGIDCAKLSLGGLQEELAAAILETKKPVITVFIAGRPYAAEEIYAKTNALLYAFYPGVAGGQALAEILFGIREPSGRLPVSIPRHAGQLPVYYNSKGSYDAMRYRDIEYGPVYSFGEGMGYTRFEYRTAELSRTNISVAELERGEAVVVKFTAVNAGERGGFTVPQLYIRRLGGSTVPRRMELKAFGKLLVDAGGSAEASLTLDWESLSIWDSRMRRRAEAGSVELLLCDCGKTLWTGVLTLV